VHQLVNKLVVVAAHVVVVAGVLALDGLKW
jgi:hypothetical protein